MERGDRGRFGELLGMLFGYYGDELAPTVAEIYWLGLKQLTIDAVEQAVSKHIQDPKVGQFRPKVADLVRQAVDAAGGDAGLRAWTALTRAMNRVGAYESVEFEDGIMGTVIANMGGWPKMCRTEDDEWPFVRNEFVKRYEGCLTRGEMLEPRRLLGVFEGTNASTGFLDPRYTEGVAPAMRVRRDGGFELLPAQRVAALPRPQTGANVAEDVAAPLAGAVHSVMKRLRPPEEPGNVG